VKRVKKKKGPVAICAARTSEQDIPLDEMLRTVSSTSSLKPKGDAHFVPSASARATSSSPSNATTSCEMTSSEDPGSSGVCFLFLLRLDTLGFMPTFTADCENSKRGFLSSGRRHGRGGEIDLVFEIEFSISRRAK
jgi:hypothetical protein